MNITVLKERERRAYLQMGKLSQEEVKKLLQELGKACGEAEYVEDYAWLNMVIIRWETYLKSEFGESYLTPMKKPRKELKRRMEVDVLELKELIGLAESAVDLEKCTLVELKRSLRQKETEALTSEKLIEGLEREELNEERKRLLGNETVRLKRTKKKIEKVREYIAFWVKQLKEDQQILNRWKKKVESAIKAL